MLSIDDDKLLADLERDEGVRLKPYRDTVGKLTLGCGRNLDDVGITSDEARYLCRNDMERVRLELERELPWLEVHPEPVQRAIANMVFNLGIYRLLGFVDMLAALRVADYERAANEALDSKWSTQVGARAQRIAEAIRNSK